MNAACKSFSHNIIDMIDNIDNTLHTAAGNTRKLQGTNREHAQDNANKHTINATNSLHQHQQQFIQYSSLMSRKIMNGYAIVFDNKFHHRRGPSKLLIMAHQLE